MHTTLRNRLASRKRQIQRRLDKTKLGDCSQPAFRARNIHYDIADRVRGLAQGGIGAFHLLARKIGLIDAIDRGLQLLKIHLPYHESDHVLNIAYNGVWGYHPLIVSLANTREVLRLVNRSGNRPSHDGAADALDRAIATCRRGGFRKILLRGDTDFSQTQHLDRWSDNGVRFIFGYDSKPNLVDLAEALPERVWHEFQWPGPATPQARPRQRPDNVKDRIVRQRGFETLRLQCEDIADWNYRPHACTQEYRLIIVRKNISKEKGELRLLDEIRYLFYLTNDWVSDAEQIVLAHDRPDDQPLDPTHGANGRCHQENLIQQLKNRMHALTAPVDNLESNWAYMVMTALAWNLKAWAALMLPEEPGRWHEKHRAEKVWLMNLEFKAFVHALVAIPCQIIRQARRILYRVLAYNPHQPLFFRLVAVLRC